jgi:ubiquinone/menaquinone biosynthesis C-methylase UbiE
MDALHIAEGTTVLDLGAGGGWFTSRLARRVGPNGRVYAVDVQSLMIQAIVRRMQREGLTNVTPVLGDYDDPSLPANVNPDAVLIVDTFHEAEHPVVLLQNVARTLKPQGRIGIIDYREGEGGPGPGPEERVPPGVVISQALTAGLKLVEQHKFLPYQYFLIFGR